MDTRTLASWKQRLASRVGSLRILAVLFICPTVLAATAQDQARFDVGQLPDSAIPYIERAVLTANTANAVRMLVPANQSAGVDQIKALTAGSNFEEQWAFVPAINLWIEIGGNESVSELDSSVETDVAYLKEIVRLYDVVQIFHFHPAEFYLRVWDDTLTSEVSAEATGDEPGPIGFALPSPTDVMSSIQLSEAILADYPHASITHSVVSPHGLMTYGATVLGLDRIRYEQGNPRATLARSIVSRIAIRRMEFNIAKTIAVLDDPSIGEVIHALALQCTDQHFEVAFAPF